jgi:segregation and condensation protein A
MTAESVPAIVEGTPFEEWPTDLYVPPDALQIFLESFEGPLDLLLYLIQKQNFDILNIPIAEITRQYLQYVELMKQMNLDLAAEYLVMAAVLLEIKSRLLLPSKEEDESKDDEDPRTKLVKQLREYAQYKQAAEDLDALPRIGRDIFIAMAEPPEIAREIILPNVSWTALLEAMRDVIERSALFSSHQVIREPLSVRERMTLILDSLTASPRIDFIDCFTPIEGRAGVVVTLLAILELAKESTIQIIQQQPFEIIQVLKL